MGGFALEQEEEGLHFKPEQNTIVLPEATNSEMRSARAECVMPLEYTCSSEYKSE